MHQLSFLFFLALVSAWPGVMVYFLILTASSRWNKVLVLAVVVFITLVYGEALGSGEDDRFGFATLTQYFFWFFLALGAFLGWLIRAIIDRRHWLRAVSGSGTVVDIRKVRQSHDVIFAVLLASVLPLYPLYYGWFGGVSGLVLFSLLGSVVVLAAYGFFRSQSRTAAGRFNVLKIFFGVSALAWLSLAGFALYTGSVVEARAREVAAGAPYCQESGMRKLSHSWDMTILNMRQLRRFNFNTEFAGQLVVNRNGALERYHWSHRHQDFHGNGRVYSESICLKEFGSDTETEQRRDVDVKLAYTPREFRNPRGSRVFSSQSAILAFFAYGPVLVIFAAHLMANKRRLPSIVVSTVVVVGVEFLIIMPLGKDALLQTLWSYFVMIAIGAVAGIGTRLGFSLLLRRRIITP